MPNHNVNEDELEQVALLLDKKKPSGLVRRHCDDVNSKRSKLLSTGLNCLCMAYKSVPQRFSKKGTHVCIKKHEFENC